ncbi:MAG TPA: hypothetical protein VH165_02635 [Kofleriaceae bacterium]|nr:hypothetical protein [Kofleriaceae bacterium]
MGPSRWAVVCIAIAAGACSAGDNTVDPSDLALRDLLGVSPDVATAWSAPQRTAARRVLIGGLRADDTPAELAAEPSAAGAGAGSGAGVGAGSGSTAPGLASDDRVASLLATGDVRRAAEGAAPLGVVGVHADPTGLAITPHVAASAALLLGGAASPGAAHDGGEQPRSLAPGGTAPAAMQLLLAEQWDTDPRWSHLPGRGLDVLSALAVDAAHPGGPVVVVPAPRLTVIAAYVAHDDTSPPHLEVNPILLAALEPEPDEVTAATAVTRWSPAPGAPRRALAVPRVPGAIPGAALAPAEPHLTPPASEVTGGNPYSFYGSFEECAQAQRARCEACLPGNTCTPVTDTSDGNAECTSLADNSGRGYFLLCIDLSLAITSVDRCAGDAAPSCPRDAHAADSLATLDANTDFLDNPACAGALDGCLAKIYGAPEEPFPGPDGGTVPTTPPRSTSVDCGHACDHDNTNCSASPNVDCSGPTCNNSQSCDSSCSSSDGQSGCGGNCNSCSSNSSGNTSSCGGSTSSSSSGGSCGSSSSSSGSCGGDGCSGDSCSSGSGSGSGSGGSGSGGGSSGGGSSGGGCGGGSGSGSGGGGCGGGSDSSGCNSCGGGDSSKCSAAPADPGPGLAAAMSLLWGLLPVPFAAFTRRRARMRRGSTRPASPEPDRPSGGEPSPEPRRDSGNKPSAVLDRPPGSEPSPEPRRDSGNEPSAVPRRDSSNEPSAELHRDSGSEPSPEPRRDSSSEPSAVPRRDSGSEPSVELHRDSGGEPSPEPDRPSGSATSSGPDAGDEERSS